MSEGHKNLEAELAYIAELGAGGPADFGALPKRRRRTARTIVVMLVLAAAALLVWASRAELDQVVRAIGSAIPDSASLTIQSLEPGIVSEIHVKEGDTVKAGDLLLKLNDKVIGARYRENILKQGAIEARLLRLLAEATGAKELVFSEELRARSPERTETELRLFASRAADMEAQKSLIEDKLKNLQDQYRLLKPSLDRGTAPKLDGVKLQGQIVALNGELRTLVTGFERLTMEQLDAQKAELQSLKEAVLADKDRLERTTIRSHVDGVVNAIHIEKVGMVVQSAQPIMEIVPNEDSLLIEARVRPEDIGFIVEGQKANVRFTAFDFSLYGGMEGTVVTVSADTVTGEDGQPFYAIKVRTKERSLGFDAKDGSPLLLRPGMVAEVDVVTGKRTVLQYLLYPINRAKMMALRER